MGPGDLSEALAALPASDDPRLLVGHGTSDDAGVFRVSPDLALVQTVDFFAPIVDDPYTFGRVAATNALSDVYAMGGVPLTAMNIVAFPTDRLPMTVLSDILRGGHDTVHEAGAVIVGGHTVVDEELKYGLAVTGRVDPTRMLTNAAARVGEHLVLTKPLGNGMVATALKQRTAETGSGKGGRRGAVASRGRRKTSLPADAERTMVEFMTRLNRRAAEAAVAVGARCATDVTGFGLLGHASHIARASRVTLAIAARSVPILTGAREAFALGARTGGERRNADYLEDLVNWGKADAFRRALLVDPQTSGGLLVAVPPGKVAEYLSYVPGAADIGEVRPAGAYAIVIE
jgi:selenide, water dikinase